MALKKNFIVVGSLVVLAGAIALFAALQAQRGAAVTYLTVPADKGPIEAKVTATGTLSALVTVQVGSQVSGRIQQLRVDFNSPVKKGEVLAKLDPQLLDAALAQARANDALAESNLLKNEVQAQDAQRQYRRSEQLFSQKLIAQADRDTAKATSDAARAQVNSAAASVAQAQAGLHQAQVNLAYATIISPIDGVVISRNIDVGQTVAASFQAPTLFVIAQDLRKLQVDASVAEADVGKLSAHLPAQFTVDAFPAETFSGVVRQIRNAPQTLQNVVTYDAIIDVNNPKLQLRPGMTANVSFTYDHRTDVLRVPNTALRFKPPLVETLAAPQTRKAGLGRKRLNHNARTVWVLKDDKPQGVPIHTGLSDGTYTEVVSGKLQVGDRLITDSTDAAQGASTTTPPRLRGL